MRLKIDPMKKLICISARVLFIKFWLSVPLSLSKAKIPMVRVVDKIIRICKVVRIIFIEESFVFLKRYVTIGIVFLIFKHFIPK